jgi:hypothetical protein
MFEWLRGQVESTDSKSKKQKRSTMKRENAIRSGVDASNVMTAQEDNENIRTVHSCPVKFGHTPSQLRLLNAHASC